MAYRKRKTSRITRSRSSGYTRGRTVRSNSRTSRRTARPRAQTLRIVVEQAGSALPASHAKVAGKAVF